MKLSRGSWRPRSASTFFGLGVLVVVAAAPSRAQAGFNWGSDCSFGEKRFDQYVAYRSTVTIGEIPGNKRNVSVALRSAVDLDLQLIDRDTGASVVQWPRGILNGARAACADYKGVSYCYGGYHGDQTQSGRGNEWIRIEGDTNRALILRAFGYSAGQSTVTHRWEAVPTCAEKGTGQFTKRVRYEELVTVGEIPPGKTNVRIALAARSGRDVDIQLYDGATKIVAWDATGDYGLLFGPTEGSVVYETMLIAYSGYNGRDGDPGKEEITITGKVNRALTMRALGYQSGHADVSYAWGEGAGARCDGIAALSCADGLVCKGHQVGISEPTGTCHADGWCHPDTTPFDCMNLPQPWAPGKWSCREFACQFVPDVPARADAQWCAQLSPARQTDTCCPSSMECSFGHGESANEWTKYTLTTAQGGVVPPLASPSAGPMARAVIAP